MQGRARIHNKVTPQQKLDGTVSQGRSSVTGQLLERAFFEASPEKVAPRLLGKVLARRTTSGWIAGRIVEAEAYLGPHHATPDPAAHSHRGPTPRNRVLFGPAGYAYVYTIYGRYFCMNISCEREGQAGCVLLRALEPVAGLDLMAHNRGLSTKRRRLVRGDAGSSSGYQARELTCGPSRLCQALGLTRVAHNGLDLLDGDSPLQVRDDGLSVREVLVTRRIGLRDAVELPLRFALPGHTCVSGPKSLTGKCIFLRAKSVHRVKQLKSNREMKTR
jgi:DNA-3-methyladenine glycosylase